jgi:flagellar biosynthesis/type III secretory pathway protein FliH
MPVNVFFQMTKSLEGDVENMCNLSKSVFNNGFNSGFDNGFHDGFDNGFVNGQENALAESVKELMKTTKWDIDTCMDAINISSEKRDTIKAVVLGVTSIT